MDHPTPDYIFVNKTLWDERTAHHVKSDFYDLENFKRGKTSLNGPELTLLGNIAGKSLLHLQCHFGQDTLSLARMGAIATGIDFSPAAIVQAKTLSQEINAPADFICCNVYDTRQHVPDQFDIVFSSYGTIGWLPDLARWATVVADSLMPGGTFVFAEFHPAVWMFDNDFQNVSYSYFNASAIIEQEHGTYADRSAPINHQSITWNHSLHEVIQSLLNAGLHLEHFEELDYSPYNIFPDSIRTAEGRFGIRGMDGLLPIMYTLKLTKP